MEKDVESASFVGTRTSLKVSYAYIACVSWRRFWILLGWHFSQLFSDLVFEASWEPFWDHLGTIFGPSWEPLGAIFGLMSGLCGNLLQAEKNT